MCRLTAYLGPPILVADLVTRPNRSIITQSFSARERVTARGYLNGDGFGLGWYPALPPVPGQPPGPEEPCVFTSTGPAWNNENLARLAKSITSPIVYAHVRAATAGLSVCECCCHPFHFKHYMWMHNGMIGGFRMVRRRLLETLNDTAFAFAVAKGESDSALCFALFINELEDLTATLPPDVLRRHLDKVVSVITAAVLAEGVKEVSMLNFVVSDGRSLLATRFVHDPSNATDPVAASLYFASGTRYECKDAAEGEYRMVHADRRDNLAIITSEPLTNDPTDWVTVPVNHSVIVTDDMHVLVTPIGSSSPAITATLTSLTRHYYERNASRPQSRHPAVRVPSEDTALERVEVEHKLSGHSDTVLSLAAVDGYLFSGSQDGTIRAWDPREFKCVEVLRGHEGSVLALVVAQGFLFSASSDNTIQKWSTQPPFECLGALAVPHQGDILSLAAHHDFLYAGFQDTCIRRISISKFPTDKLVRTRNSPATDLCAGCCTYTPTRGPHGTLEVFAGFVGPTCRTRDSHYGYVYALLMCGSRLCSGAGDGCVMVWDVQEKTCQVTLNGHTGSVLALTCDAEGTTLFSGSRDSSIRVWDLEGLCCKRTLQGHTSDVLSLHVAGSLLYSGGADGRVLVWSLESLTQLLTLASGPDTVQALALSRSFGLLFSGSSNNSILAWRTAASHACTPVHCLTPADASADSDAEMLINEPAPLLVDSLRVFVSFPSVSGSDQHRAPCWRAAKYLARQMRLLSCSEVRLLPCGDDRNPIVYGRMLAGRDRPTVVVYGHYDVQPATEAEWVSSPWQLRALDGYLYGRGTTDNKGPILAFLYAAHELRCEHLLDCNLVFLFEGEEETHSDGFREAMAQLSAQPVEESGLENVSMVLVSNNYWIDDLRPCLTYGTRGVIHIDVSITGPARDVHSGVDGGALVEPLCDLVCVLASLTSSRGEVLVPGFYDDVCAMTAEEEALFEKVTFDVGDYCSNLGVRSVTSGRSRDVLAARWSSPTLSVVFVDSSNNARSFSKIPHSATAKLSIRFVPRQTASRLVALVTSHLETEFAKRRSPNLLKVEAVHCADWWLGDPKSTVYSAASRAIEQVWGQTPMLVREGGTMPITSFLSSHLSAPALLLPMGQASDGAHLANERIRLSNLLRGKDVIKHLLINLYGPPAAQMPLSTHPLPVRVNAPDSPRRTSGPRSFGPDATAPGIVVTSADEISPGSVSPLSPARANAAPAPAPCPAPAIRQHSFEHGPTSLFARPSHDAGNAHAHALHTSAPTQLRRMSDCGSSHG